MRHPDRAAAAANGYERGGLMAQGQDDKPEVEIRYRAEETRWETGRQDGNVLISIPITLNPGWPQWERNLFPTVVIREEKWIELQRGVRDFFCPYGADQRVGLWLAAYLLETTILATPDAVPLGEDTNWYVEPPPDQVDLLRFIDPRKARRMAGVWYVCGKEPEAHKSADPSAAEIQR